MRRIALVVLGCALLVGSLLSGTASAGWLGFGGGGTRDGFSPDYGNGPPMTLQGNWSDSPVPAVRTSGVASSQGPGGMFGATCPPPYMAYGADDGRVHFRSSNTNAEFSPAGGVLVGDGPGTFGSGRGSVSPVVAAGLCDQTVLAVHNQVAGVFVAEAGPGPCGNGAPPGLHQNLPIAGAQGLQTQSSPIFVAPPRPGTSGALFFVAGDTQHGYLFRVTVSYRADTSQPPTACQWAIDGVGATRTADLSANLYASPTAVAVYDQSGRPTIQIVVGTNDGRLLSFALSDLAPGMNAVTGLGGAVGTPSQRMTCPPGVVCGAPFGVYGELYAQFTIGQPIFVPIDAGGVTRVAKLTQDGNAQAFSTVQSRALPGGPGLAVAVDRPLSRPRGSDGHVFVPTGRNLYSLWESDLTVAGRFDGNDSLTPGTTGFSNTAPVATGDFVALSDDSGRAHLLDTESLGAITGSSFDSAAFDGGASQAHGQPWLSIGGICFSNDRGVACYRPTTFRYEGYRQVGADGGVFAYGQAQFRGSTGGIKLNAPIVGAALMRCCQGYWLAAKDGGVFSFPGPMVPPQTSTFYGSAANLKLTAPIVAIAPGGTGYYLAAADGGVFAYGAQFRGSMGGTRLAAPIVGIATTQAGYYLTGRDGGVFTFGPPIQGSAAPFHPTSPIVAIAAGQHGYWLLGADGGVFAFGERFYGSAVGKLHSPAVSITAAQASDGYYITSATGEVLALGNTRQFGSTSDLSAPHAPTVAVIGP